MAEEKSKSANFVSKIVKDPKNPPDVLLLTGFPGASHEDKHRRLYLDPQLSSYVDFPDDAVVYEEALAKEHSPLGASHVWIKSDTKISSSKGAAAGAGIGGRKEMPIATVAEICLTPFAAVCNRPTHFPDPCPVYPTLPEVCRTFPFPCRPHTFAPPCILPCGPLTHIPQTPVCCGGQTEIGPVNVGPGGDPAAYLQGQVFNPQAQAAYAARQGGGGIPQPTPSAVHQCPSFNALHCGGGIHPTPSAVHQCPSFNAPCAKPTHPVECTGFVGICRTTEPYLCQPHNSWICPPTPNCPHTPLCPVSAVNCPSGIVCQPGPGAPAERMYEYPAVVTMPVHACYHVPVVAPPHTAICWSRFNICPIY